MTVKQTENLKDTLTKALNSLEGYTLVKTEYLMDLIDDSDLLDCLKVAGVNNWDGYDAALEMFNDEE